MPSTSPTCFLSTRLTRAGLFAATVFRQKPDGSWRASQRFDMPLENRRWLEGPWRGVPKWRSCTAEEVEAYASRLGGEWHAGLADAVREMLAKREKLWEKAFTATWSLGEYL